MKEEVKKAVCKICFYAGFSIGFTMVKLGKLGEKLRAKGDVYEQFYKKL